VGSEMCIRDSNGTGLNCVPWPFSHDDCEWPISPYTQPGKLTVCISLLLQMAIEIVDLPR
jgi:hypothetical protein